MNTEQIIEDQVELYVLEQQMPLTYADPLRNALRRAVEQAIQQEREACAKVVEEAPCECCWPEGSMLITEELAAAIRARGNE